MLMQIIDITLTCISTCFGWFFAILEPLGNGGSGGVVLFTGIFFGLFACYKFVDLFLMNFIKGSGTSTNDAKGKVKSEKGE